MGKRQSLINKKLKSIELGFEKERIDQEIGERSNAEFDLNQAVNKIKSSRDPDGNEVKQDKKAIKRKLRKQGHGDRFNHPEDK